MRTVNRTRPHTTVTRRNGHRANQRPDRWTSDELVSEAVVAAYIHEISARHHPAAGPGRARRQPGARV